MQLELVKQYIAYRTARSGGKGGQNVNKVETKVEAVLDVANCAGLDDAEKERILEKLSNQISKEGLLSVTAQTERSQLLNKQIATDKLIALLEKALHKPKKRRPTAVPQSVIEARTQAKRHSSVKKETRRKVDISKIKED